MKTKLLLLCLLLTAHCGLMTATVRYVSKTGSSTPPYTSWATASDSIQKCINICQNGDTVYVANGVYKEQVVMIPGLSLIGGGTDSCIIDTKELAQPTDFFTIRFFDSCLIKGFSIFVSTDEIGFGIGANGSIVSPIAGLIENNKIFNAFAGIRISNSNVEIKKMSIMDVERGILISAGNNNFYPTIDSNLIAGRLYGITVSVGTKPTIRNNTFYLDDPFASAYSGGGSDTAKVYNNLAIVDRGYYIYGISNVPTLCRNNFGIGSFEEGIAFGVSANIANNTIVDGLTGYKKYSGNSTVKHNDSWNNQINYQNFIPDSTNLSVDPMIVNDDTTQGALDFHLQKYSPLIDAGDPNISDVDGSRSDIGLYGGPFGESYTYYDLAPRPPRNIIAIVDTNKIILKWNRNTEADTSYYKIYRDTVINFTVDSTKLISSQADTVYTQTIPHKVIKYVYKVTCVDKQGNESRPSEERVVNLTSINDYPMTINDYRLYPNYPNPFNSSTTISYKLKERGYVKLMVYDIKGELVDVLVNKEQEAGYYETVFNAEVSSKQSAVGNDTKKGISHAAGIYIYTIIVKGENGIPVFIDTGKMIYIK